MIARSGWSIGKGFRYTPLVAYFFASIEPIGWLGWTVIGFATLALLRNRRLIGLLLLSRRSGPRCRAA